MLRRYMFLVVLLMGIVLTACDNNDNTPPSFEFLNLQGAQQVYAGDQVQITYADNDAETNVTSDFFADIDGDLGTGGDQVVIARGRPDSSGQPQSFFWNTSGTPAGVYFIIAVTRDPDPNLDVTTTAPGKVTVVSFSFQAPLTDRNALAAATIDIDYFYSDPDSTPTTTAYADRDGDLNTTDDQYLIEEDRDENGGSQTISWDTAGVDPGTYFLILVNDDGTRGSRNFTAPGRITIITVTAFAPQDETTLLSTAYNVRITFSQPLTFTGAVINSSTIVISQSGSTGTVAGIYTLENNDREISFTPDSTFFDAPFVFTMTVRTSMLSQDGSTVTSASSAFATRLSDVFVTGNNDTDISVMSMDDPKVPVETGTLALDAADGPFYGICASDGMLYLSNRFGRPGQPAAVVVYDTVDELRVTEIPLSLTPEPFLTGGAGLALSPDEKRLYCAAFEAPESFDGPEDFDLFLSVIDRKGMFEIAKVRLNFKGWPRAVTVSPDGSRIFIANYWSGYIHVVDALTLTELDTDGVVGNGISPIPTSSPWPSGLAVSAENSTLYASHGQANSEENGNGNETTVDVSTFDTGTFVEGAPLISTANASAGAPNLLFDAVRQLLYVPRAQIFLNGDAEGLSVFTPFSPVERIVDTSFPGTSNRVLRDVDLIWGSRYLVLADRDTGIIVVDLDVFQTAGAGTSSVAAGDVATIPPKRH